jgi:amino acid adenylation domain-containing protein
LLTGVEKGEYWGAMQDAGAPFECLIVLNADEKERVADVQMERVLFPAVVDSYPSSPPAVSTTSSDVAYILYTSGSTGDPKGVILSHSNGLAFVDWAATEYEVGPADRLSSHAPLHFDLSIFDLFAAASGAAAVVLVPAQLSIFPVRLASFIADEEISIWYSVPSVLSQLVLRGNLIERKFPKLRAVLFAGEVFPTKYLFQLMELLPHARFTNLYGPTETNVCTWYDVPPPAGERPEAIPIGEPITGVEVFAIAEDGRLAAPAEVGELCVRGATVMQGYWGDPEKTEKAFLNDPGRGRAYRTGDLVKRDEEGNYWFLGRRDAQIKSRGYRIELGEIEAVLNSHPGVMECALVAIPDELISNRIKAYVVLGEDTTVREVINFCSDRLPHYMVPEGFEERTELPKTSTGKVDRRTLLVSGS